MPLTGNSASPFSFKRLLLLATFASPLLVEAGCTQQKPVDQRVVTVVTTDNSVDAAAGPQVTLILPGENPDITISLNPCKGETPGNVLGVSEQVEPPQRVTAFISKLSDPDPKVRACAARQLGYLGAAAKQALPHLIRLAREDEHKGVRWNASDALWEIGPETSSTIDERLAALKAQDAAVRLYAAFALGYYRPHPAREKEVVSALAAATKDQDAVVRWMAVRGLMRMGPSARSAMPTLVSILLDRKSPLRPFAAGALGNIGPSASAAAPAMLNVVYTTEDDTLYIWTAIALGKIGPSVLPLLAKDLKTNKTLRILGVLENIQARRSTARH